MNKKKSDAKIVESEQKLKGVSEMNQKQLQNILLNAPAALCILEGTEHKYILANNAYEKLTNRKATDLLGKNIREVFPELIGTATFVLLDKVFETGESFTDIEYAALVDLNNEGVLRQCYFNLSIETLRNDSGEIYAVILVTYDITKHILARKKIEESENRYHELIYSSPSAIGILQGEDLVITVGNEAIINIWGKGKEIIGKKYFEALPEIAEQGYGEVLAQVYKTGIPFNAIETPVFTLQNGKTTLKYYNFILYPQRNINKEIYGIGIIATEVTSQALLNKKIEESDKKFRNLVEQAPVAMCFFRGDNFVVEVVNEKQQQLTGKTREQVMNIPAFTSIPETVEQGYQDIFEGVYKTGIPFIANENPLTIIHDGKEITTYTNFILEPIYNAERKIDGVFSVAVDVTEQVLVRKIIEESEIEIRKVKEHLEMSIKAGNIGLFSWDAEKDFLYWSDEQKEMFGLSLSENINSLAQFQSFVLPEDWERMIAMIQGPNIILEQSFDFRIKRKNDGEIRWLSSKSKVVLDDKGNVKFISGVNIDVTEQVITQNKIEESEQEIRKVKEQLELSIEAGKIGVWHWDVKKDILTWSKEQKEIYGFNNSEIITNSAQFNDLIFPEDLKRIQDDQSAGNKLEHEYDFRISRKNDGETRWVKSKARNTLDPQGVLLSISGVNIDVTEQVITQKKIEESEQEIRKIKEQLELSVSAGKIGLWNWDAKTDVLQWNNEQREMYGIEQSEELNGLAQIQSFILPEDWERIIKNIEGPNIVLDQEYDFRIKRKNDGEIRWIKSKSKVLLDENGGIKFISGVNIDISEQIYAMTEVKESENRFRSMADASPVFIWTIDANGSSSYYNKTFRDFIGVSKEEDIADWGKIVHPDDVQSIFDAINRAVVEHHSYGLECRLLRADGQWRWVLAQGNPRLGANNEFLGFVGSSIDITERKLFENKLIEANELAENAVKSKQQFLSNMSHEIRTPLNSILGFANVLLKTELGVQQKEFLQAIKTSGKSLNLLINDILDLAKVDAGKMSFEKEPFEIRKSITSILHSFDLKIKEKNLKLIKEYDSKIPKMLLGDSLRLNQIFLNILSNAVKFTQKGEITLSIKLLSETNENVTLEFVVTDSGIGIADDKLNSIFNLFEQAELSTANSYGGTGLGLAIVKQLIEVQGGSISLTSKLGEGSTFSFVLPFGRTEIKLEEEIEILKPDSEIKKLQVLVAEDVALNQLLIKMILSDFGFEYEIAENGKIAVEKLQTKTYDIVLMDLQMPEMNGFEATDYIRKTMKSKIPIIALTADVTTVDVKKCKEFGMDDYISKPIDENLLYGKIVELVKKKR